MATHKPEIFVGASADPTFMHQMLTQWASCVARYHDFHTPESWHEDNGRVIWDSVSGQIERSQVGVLTAAAWLARGVALTEISKRKGIEGERHTQGFEDFYLCSPGYKAFEGEAKVAYVGAGMNGDQISSAIEFEFHAAQQQYSHFLDDTYTFSPLMAVFVSVSSNTAQNASQAFTNCLSAIRGIAHQEPRVLGTGITAYAAQRTEIGLPIKWAQVNRYHPGAIVCLREYKPWNNGARPRDEAAWRRT